MQEKGTGFLKVRAVSARGALPVEGAFVIIIDEETKNTVASLRTDPSGLTDTVSLTVPGRELSQSPSVRAPYATYTVQVSKEGYYSVSDYTVPVFDGITSVQGVNLIPRGEYSAPGPDQGSLSVETPDYSALKQKS